MPTESYDTDADLHEAALGYISENVRAVALGYTADEYLTACEAVRPSVLVARKSEEDAARSELRASGAELLKRALTFGRIAHDEIPGFVDIMESDPLRAKALLGDPDLRPHSGAVMTSEDMIRPHRADAAGRQTAGELLDAKAKELLAASGRGVDENGRPNYSADEYARALARAQEELGTITATG